MADQDELRQLVDRDGVSLPDAVGAHGVDLDKAIEARSQLENAGAYLELHIEQGPVLESMGLPLGAVLGTFGVERHRVVWRGQAAHAGSTPMDQRRDALAGASKLALALREIAASVGGGAVCTSGDVVCKPGIVTSVVETAEQLLDQRHLDASKLSSMLADAKSRSEEFAREENIEVDFERIWNIEPILFDEELIGFADEAIREVAGESHRLPSGPLHDAAEVSRAGIPTVMVFVQSLRGLSHTKLEDTKEEHLELSVQALDRLASRTIERLAAHRGLVGEVGADQERGRREAPESRPSHDTSVRPSSPRVIGGPGMIRGRHEITGTRGPSAVVATGRVSRPRTGVRRGRPVVPGTSRKRYEKRTRAMPAASRATPARRSALTGCSSNPIQPKWSTASETSAWPARIIAKSVTAPSRGAVTIEPST